MDGYLDRLDTLNSRQFLIAVRKLADSLSFGADHSPFLGSGVEYVQSRQYQIGDPIKSIDWRVTARTGKVFVKQYEAPRQLPCYMLIDTSASMTISSYRKSKYMVALHLAGGLALACLDRISPVGVVGVGDLEFRVEPSLSKHQIMQWLARLRRFRYDESTRLGQRVDHLIPRLNSRAMVMVFSDLHERNAISALKRLAQKHDCVALQLRDPAERGIRGAGFLRAQHAESGREMTTRAAHNRLDQETVNEQLKRSGIDHLIIDTDKPFVRQLRHFFKARNLLGRGSR